MNKVFNRENERWIRPWNEKQFDDLYNRDERFFSLVIKGLISWLNRNIVLYDESVNHFIFNTGSSYLYMESNGYEYTLSETTGEDTMYMKLPRCIMEITDVNIPMEELSAPFSRGTYERRNGNMICGYNAEMRRLPIELTIQLKYYLSNFNETLILLQELIDKLVFQRYYNIIYLGQIVQCSIEFPANYNPEINKIDMTSPEPNQRNIGLDVKICTNYPIIDTRTEIPTDKVINMFGKELDLYLKGQNSDKIHNGDIINNDINDFENFDKGYNKEFKDEIEYAINNMEFDTLISKLDINNDNVIDEIELNDVLEKMKYGYIDIEDLSDNSKYVNKCHYHINYKDIYYLIEIINKQDTVSAHYDRFLKKIYVTHNDTGNTEEIDIAKYNIVN